jgi:PAS domain S-box-containing protein
MMTLDPAKLRLAAVVESSDDAIVSLALDGKIETWNRAAERLFGYTAKEVIGRSIETIVPEENRAEERQVLADVRNGQGVSHYDTYGLTRSGLILPLSVAVSPILTPEGQVVGLSRISRDMTAQRALERDAMRLAAIVDSAEDAIVSKDLNGVVQTWNSAAERMFGYGADEIIGKPIRVIIPADRQQEEDRVLASIRAGIPIEHFDTIRQRKDGTLIEISLSVSPIRTARGAIIGASKIARDVSKQKALARELAEANRVKDEFLATLSHELRTPLNAVLGYTRMLRMGQLAGGGREERAFDIIERNANMLSQLVSDVLDVSSIVTGKIRLKLADCDVASIVKESIDVVAPSAEAKGIAVRFESHPGTARVMCDGGRLHQVFSNLLGNAVKFTPRGGRIDVRVTRNANAIEVAIADTGVGIRAEALPYVFQRFWQGESANSRQFTGLGLGLALAHHFVELHGGTIRAASAGEGHGSTFTVSLPIAS